MCESSNFSISGKSIPAAKSAEGTQADKSAKDLGDEGTLPGPWYKVDDFSTSFAELMKYCIKPEGQNPYDLDCHKYVDCSDSKVFLKICHPPSLVFDPITSQCKWNSELGMADRCKNFKNIFFLFAIF